MTTKRQVEKFESNTGVRIYRIPMLVFPKFVGYSYLLFGAGVLTLFDTGSGFGQSNDDLLAGLAAVKNNFSEDFNLSDIERIILTHGHTDHIGGLTHILEAIDGATIGIHPLDRRILTNYEERRTVATKDLMIFFERAGVPQHRIQKLKEMYNWSKQHVKSVKVDFMVEEGQVLDGMAFYHVPGHCSGQVAIRIGDILLTADHILSRTSPHVAAESITNWTGLAHYREALRKIRKLEGIRLGLGGHEKPIDDLHGRIDVLQTRIDEKLRMMLDMIRDAGKPLTINDISKLRYPNKHGFDVLLALQEAGAFIEYLYDRGYLGIANLDEVEAEQNPPLLYYVLE
ncbi:MAG: MBL fold metallo-hydrolase [Anaerolineae bacterium]|nr:MBL fold metallo-hydrolase [Anaerolineae bacterium]